VQKGVFEQIKLSNGPLHTQLDSVAAISSWDPCDPLRPYEIPVGREEVQYVLSSQERSGSRTVVTL
jgi:hypothetical protein